MPALPVDTIEYDHNGVHVFSTYQRHPSNTDARAIVRRVLTAMAVEYGDIMNEVLS